MHPFISHVSKLTCRYAIRFFWPLRTAVLVASPHSKSRSILTTACLGLHLLSLLCYPPRIVQRHVVGPSGSLDPKWSWVVLTRIMLASNFASSIPSATLGGCRLHLATIETEVGYGTFISISSESGQYSSSSRTALTECVIQNDMTLLSDLRTPLVIHIA